MSDIIPTPPPDTTPSLPFRRPADYYSTPVSEVRPIFPRWVAFGCGAASLVAIIVLFGIGMLASSGKGNALFAGLFGTVQTEIEGMFTKQVTPAQKTAFETEMKALRANLSAGKMSVEKLQPFLQEMREASADSSVSPDEAVKLTDAAHKANAAAAQQRPRATPGR